LCRAWDSTPGSPTMGVRQRRRRTPDVQACVRGRRTSGRSRAGHILMQACGGDRRGVVASALAVFLGRCGTRWLATCGRLLSTRQSARPVSVGTATGALSLAYGRTGCPQAAPAASRVANGGRHAAAGHRASRHAVRFAHSPRYGQSAQPVAGPVNAAPARASGRDPDHRAALGCPRLIAGQPGHCS
jgi:hypothetical protein